MQSLDTAIHERSSHVPWNKGKLLVAKPPLRTKHVWAIRTKLQVEGRTRDLVAAAFLDALWSSNHLHRDDYQATSHLLRELLKDRTEDYRAILDALDQRLAHRTSFRIYLRQWASGHFMGWPR